MNYLYFLYIEFLAKHGIPQILGDITFFVIPATIIFIALLLVILALVLFERKLLGWFTQRKGPNRVGYWGILQTIADALKLLCKENITPQNADKFLFNFAPILMFIPTLIVLGLIPYSAEFTFMNFQTNLLIYIIIATMPILSILIGAWGSNNKYSLLGGMRNVAQVLAYELPIAFTVLSVTVLSSSMNLTQITLAQNSKFGVIGWYWIPCFIGFIVMFIGILAELNRSPFDLPEAESELVCGYNTEYSGMRFALFYLSEYAMLFANSLLISILFFGGYLSPFGHYLSTLFFSGNVGEILIYFEQAFWLLLKSFFIIFLIILVRASFPRMASFDLLKFSWTILLPISIINFFLMIIIKLGGLYA
jgi:NADH-quinone oxidoreductase subunit H